MNDDYMFVLFCNEDNEKENIMICQQVHHQITLLMPEIKEKYRNWKYFVSRTYIENNKMRKKMV